MSNNDERALFPQWLRLLADWYEEHPLVPIPLWLQDQGISVYLPDDEAKSILATIGSFTKRFEDERMIAVKAIGHKELHFRMARGAVCTPRVVGKKYVAEKVIPSEYRPEEVVPAHVEDIVEWDCHPVLAPEQPTATEQQPESSSDSAVESPAVVQPPDDLPF